MRSILIVLALSGCAQTGVNYSGSPRPSETVYVRDTQGRTVARITDGNIYNTSGNRIGRVSKK